MATTNYMNHVWKAVDSLRGKIDPQEYYEVVIVLAYIKLVSLSEGQDFRHFPVDEIMDHTRDTVFRFENRDLVLFMDEVLASFRNLKDDRSLFLLLDTLPDDPNDLTEMILHMPINSRGSFAEGTPESLVDLVVELLSIEPKDVVADFGMGTGTFLVKAAERQPCSLYYGCDVDTHSIGVARLRASLLKVETIIEQKDMFQVDRRFDKVFSNYPFAHNPRGFLEEKRHILEEQGMPVPKFRSSDWLFNLCLAKNLEPNGKAIGIMAAGACFNSADQETRQFFAEQGLVEAIITLPEGMFSPYTAISTRLIVISKGNKKIRMIDASKVCTRGRRLCTFSDENIESIVTLMSEDADNSKLIGMDELSENDFNFDPCRYLEDEIQVKNGMALEDAVVRITRGAGVKAAALEENVSLIPTSYRYLILANINEGQIDGNLPYLTSIPEAQRKYCAQNGDLVLSKIGPNFKSAVVETNENESVLCTGNLYIISVDQSRFNPGYVQMYLSSSDGQAQLNRVCVGTVMKSISIKDLKQIKIPEIPLAEQEEIVEKRNLLWKEIDYHKAAIEKARKDIIDLLVGE